MKKNVLLLTLALALFSALNLAAQSKTAAGKTFAAMSLNGVTGLYVVPTARIGWENAGLGFNGGYHLNFVDYDKIRGNHLFQGNLSLYRWLELAFTCDSQPFDDDDDLLFGAKLKLPVTATDIAIGANLSYNNLGSNGNHLALQLYGAVTYQAEFFSMPSETTLAVGKSFYEGTDVNSDIDFGMGFDLILFPQYLQNFLHWIIDFSNFSYSPTGWGAAAARGTLNTGLRVDLSQIPALSRFNFAVDAYVTDAFDHDTRGLGLGVMFGMSF
jgi:hypothetical protein